MLMDFTTLVCSMGVAQGSSSTTNMVATLSRSRGALLATHISMVLAATLLRCMRVLDNAWQ